jgi:hypothetical protein
MQESRQARVAGEAYVRLVDFSSSLTEVRMEISLDEVAYETNKLNIVRNLESYGEYIDSYYEDHIIESKHYRIVVDDADYGYVSLFEDEMITQFSVHDEFVNNANIVFDKIIDIKSPKNIYVSTCDKTY